MVTRTEELLFRASTCDRVALTNEECKQLVELCRLMVPLVEECCDCHAEYDNTKHKEAIAAFNKFERGE